METCEFKTHTSSSINQHACQDGLWHRSDYINKDVFAERRLDPNIKPQTAVDQTAAGYVGSIHFHITPSNITPTGTPAPPLEKKKCYCKCTVALTLKILFFICWILLIILAALGGGGGSRRRGRRGRSHYRRTYRRRRR